MRNYIMSVVVVAILMVTNTATADLVMTIGNVADPLTAVDGSPVGPFIAGDLGDPIVIPVYAHVTDTTTPANLTGYSFFIDLGGDGDQIPGTPDYFDPILTENIIDFQGPSPVVTSFAGQGAPLDYSVSVAGANIDLSATPTHLFSFVFNSMAFTPSGTYSLNFVDIGLGGTNFTGNQGTFDLADVQFDNGQFIITAIPEPGSLMLTAAAFFGLATRRRRQQSRRYV